MLTITKANTRSTVHRGTYLDFIGVKRFAADGTVIGEHRFMGLLTSAAYSMSPHQIPLLDRKVARIVERAGFPPTGHAGKALLHILETYPRDELLQTSEDELFRIAHRHPAAAGSPAAAPVRARRPVRPLCRPASCSCRATATTPPCASGCSNCSSSVGRHRKRVPGAAVRIVAGAAPVHPAHAPAAFPTEVDTADLEQRLLEISRSWPDRLRDALIEACRRGARQPPVRGLRPCLPGFLSGARRRARGGARHRRASTDWRRPDAGDLAMSLYRRLEDPAELIRFKLIRRDQPVLLSDALPILENMGLQVLSEEPSQIKARDGRLYSAARFRLAADWSAAPSTSTPSASTSRTCSRASGPAGSRTTASTAWCWRPG